MPRDTAGTQARKQADRQSANTQSATRTDRDETDRERSIETRQEKGLAKARPNRGGLTSSVYGTTGSPFSLMRRVAEDMDRLFQDFALGRSPLDLTSTGLGFEGDGWRRASPLAQSVWSPQLETFRRNDTIVVRADLPGLKREDVKVEVDNDVLTISGERAEKAEEDRDDFYRSERSYGQFYRAIPLPESVDAERCNATFKDGVLEVTFPAPKEEKSQAKQIPIR